METIGQSNTTIGSTVGPAHPRNDDRVELVSTVPTDRNNRSENTVLFSHADSGSNEHKRNVCPAAKITGHRTTFRTYDIDADLKKRRELFERLWKYQVGRGHTWENKRNHVVRNDEIWKRCDAILQYCEVPEFERESALRMTLSRSLQGFSRHYRGVDGACVGFALMKMFGSPKEAKNSWVAKRFARDIPGFDRETVMNLIEYVFRKYGAE